MKKIVLLGGSSPFTIAFLDALLEKIVDMPRCKLILQGRNSHHLSLIGAYGKKRLATYGWELTTITTISEALDGADIVIHQTRYGGLEWRAKAEKMAQLCCLPADETLGPAGLFLALATAPMVQQLAANLQQYCPGAWIINLTNPLSIVTWQLASATINPVMGLCELPQVTLRKIANFLQINATELQWSYTGLNHRGFIHDVFYQGIDCIAAIMQQTESMEFADIAIDDIQSLNAIPTKYFGLLRKNETATESRADFLANLRVDIINELTVSTEHSPPSLKKRYLAWYAEAVIPLLSAFFSKQSMTQVINFLNEDGICFEKKVAIHHEGLSLLPTVTPSKDVKKWMHQFIQHEKAVQQAVLSPEVEHISHALCCDPLMGMKDPATIAKFIFDNL